MLPIQPITRIHNCIVLCSHTQQDQCHIDAIYMPQEEFDQLPADRQTRWEVLQEYMTGGRMILV